MRNHKVMIFGGPGTGKSTLTSQLASRLGCDPIHLDDIFWLPGWEMMDKRELRDKVVEMIDGRSTWVIDGNYKDVRWRLLDEATLVVILYIPLLTNLWRLFWRIVIRRTGLSFMKVTPSPSQVDERESPEGLLETFRWFFDGVFRYYRYKSRLLWEEVRRRYPDLQVIVSNGDVDCLIDEIGSSAEMD